MIWGDKLSEWQSGHYPTHNCYKQFFFETSCITDINSSIYDETLIETTLLSNDQNYSSFNKHIQNCQDKDIAVFPNINNSAILCIPIPRKGKNFATIKDFMDNASKRHQKKFWSYVAAVITEYSSEHEKTYVSTHGTNVPYFHLRIESVPKYYITKRYIC